MRANFVEVFAPGFDEDLGLTAGPEPLHVQAFVTELAVEALQCTVLPGLARIDQRSLGGFKQSSQHFDGEGCDGQEEATVGSMWTAAIAVTRSATGGDAERAAAVLDAHCGWDEQRGGCV